MSPTESRAMNFRQIVAAVDPGSTWIRSVAAEVSSSGVKVIGAGTVRSEGISRGHVSSIQAAASAVARSVKEAEVSAGREVHSLTVLLGGETIRGVNSSGSAKVESETGVIGPREIDNAIRRAGKAGFPNGRAVVHILPQRYCIDSVCFTDEPRGMSGTRLDAETHVITSWQPGIANLRRAVRMAGNHLGHIVASPLAAGLGVDGASDRGWSALVDIGGETTKVVAWHEGRIVLTRVLPVGGSDLTRALSLKLGIDPAEAERIKCTWGAAGIETLSGDERSEGVSAPALDGRRVVEITAQRVCELLEPSVEKLLVEIRSILETDGEVDRFTGGVALAGGGANLAGLAEKATGVLGVASRMAEAGTGDLRGPEFAAIGGLVRYSSDKPRKSRAPARPRGLVGSISEGWNWLLASF